MFNYEIYEVGIRLITGEEQIIRRDVAGKRNAEKYAEIIQSNFISDDVAFYRIQKIAKVNNYFID